MKGHEHFIKKRARRSVFHRESSTDDVNNSGFTTDLNDHLINSKASSLTNNSYRSDDSHAEQAKRRYSLAAFNKLFELQVQRDSSFISPNIVLERVGVNGSERWIRTREASDCYYTGSVAGDRNSAVSLSLCGHMVSTLH